MTTSFSGVLPVNEPCLLARIARQDAGALGELYDQWGCLLYSLACRMLADRDDADVVLEKVFSRIWTEVAWINGVTINLFQWLAGLTREEALKLLRQRRQMGENEIHGPAETKNIIPLNDLFVPPFTAENRDIINTLAADERQAIEFAYFNGLTCPEISKKLGEPVSAIRARISRGVARLCEAAQTRSESRNLVSADL